MAMSRFGLRALATRLTNSRAILPVRGGSGGPVPAEKPPVRPLAEEDDLFWYDGTANPEPVLDRDEIVTSTEALRYLLAGLGGFGVLGLVAYVWDKPSKMPYVPKVFPYDGLKEELGGHSANEG